MKETVELNWKINTSTLRPEHYEEKELGEFFTDFWILKLGKTSLKGNNFDILFSIERKLDIDATKDSKIEVLLIIIKLIFSDSVRKTSPKCKFVKRFRNNTFEAKFKLLNNLKELFNKSGKIISITGEVSFHLKPDIEPVTAHQTLNTLSSDIKKLCGSELFTDIILRCDSQVFYVHKNILALRCPVFAEIIENCANDEVKIDIKDIEPGVLKVFLEYIYSGEIGELSFQLACNLLMAADIYCLNELKAICVDYIKTSFSVGNVLNYFLKYEAVKSYALQFIAENILEIKKTPEWLNFMQNFPDVVLELGDLSESKDIKHIKDIKQER